jgi:hypothetical protein
MESIHSEKGIGIIQGEIKSKPEKFQGNFRATSEQTCFSEVKLVAKGFISQEFSTF